MKSFAILLFSLVAANGIELIDYRVALDLTPEPAKDCTSAGLFCESCSSLVACMAEGDSFTKTALGACASPKTCVEGACVHVQDPFCGHIADLPFICQSVGIFPDPFYCNKFVLCVENTDGTLEAYPNECDAGYGYSASTDMCSVKLVNIDCTPDVYPVPLCQNAGDNGALAVNPSLYYFCEVRSVDVDGGTKDVLYPVLSECPHGEVYSDFRCVGKNDGNK